MTGTLASRVAIVTGGGSGIGAATARRLADDGAAVVVADIDRASAERVAEAIVAAGGRAVAQRVDVSREDEIVAMVDQAVGTWGRLDILHNNAAITSREHLGRDAMVAECEATHFLATVGVNLLGPLLASKHAIPQMLANGGGAIVNTSSETASGGFTDGMTAYVTTKGGVESLTRATAAQYGRRGIRCNAIQPGVTRPRDAPAQDPARLDVVRRSIQVPEIASPEEQAAVVAFLASDAARQINGQIINTGGGGNVVTQTNLLVDFAFSSGGLDATR